MGLANNPGWKIVIGENNSPLGMQMSNGKQKAEPDPPCIKAWPPARSQTHQPAGASALFPQGHGAGHRYGCAGGICGGVFVGEGVWRTEITIHMVDPSHFVNY